MREGIQVWKLSESLLENHKPQETMLFYSFVSEIFLDL